MFAFNQSKPLDLKTDRWPHLFFLTIQNLHSLLNSQNYSGGGFDLDGVFDTWTDQNPLFQFSEKSMLAQSPVNGIL